MKYLLIFTALITAHCSFAQTQFTYEQFENQILAFTPTKTGQISERAFSLAQRIADETRSNTKNDPGNFNLADYFNVLSMFLSLERPQSDIELAYQKFFEAEGSCYYLTEFRAKVIEIEKYLPIRERWLADADRCDAEGKVQPAKPVNLMEYAASQQLDLQLIKTIANIDQGDKLYRKNPKTDWSKQSPIDLDNQRKIDSLYTLYGTYLGKSMVGDKFSLSMWSVIQHSNVDMMEKYLPVVQAAFEAGEIDEGPFKMLIDRYYILRHGYQVFNTQSGFDADNADEATRDAIIRKFKLTH